MCQSLNVLLLCFFSLYFEVSSTACKTLFFFNSGFIIWKRSLPVISVSVPECFTSVVFGTTFSLNKSKTTSKKFIKFSRLIR